jgi:hypothetical protein
MVDNKWVGKPPLINVQWSITILIPNIHGMDMEKWLPIFEP